MTRSRRFALLVALLPAAALPAQPERRPVTLVIRAESAAFEPAAAEYRALWARDGQRIVDAMERVSGLRFREFDIPVLVIAGASSSGYGDRPLRMRASYPEPTKRATLVHELGHRLQSHLFRQEEDEHPPLFLWLYDVWVALYGQPFADEQVAVESRRRGIHDYERAWRETLALDAAGRAAAWRRIREEREGRRSPGDADERSGDQSLPRRDDDRVAGARLRL